MLSQPWLKHYPAGMPVEIDGTGFASLADFFEQISVRFASRPALSCMGATLSYAGLEEKSRVFANYLHQVLKLEKGGRVAIMMPNLLQNPVAILGALRAGLVVVNTNPLYTERELKHQLADSGAAAVVVLENFAHVLAAVLPEPGIKVRAVITTQAGDLLNFPKSLAVNFFVKYLLRKVPPYHIPGAISLTKSLAEGAQRAYSPLPLSVDDVAFLQYTGGTTGLSKGAMLTHANLLANIEQIKQWITHGNPPAKALIPGGEITVTALPLYHIYALTANFWTFLALGGLNHLIVNPRDLRTMVRTIRNLRFTCFTGVNTLFNGLLHTPGFEKTDFSALKICMGGGMPTQKGTAERWREVTGSPIIEAYGLTEASPAVCINPLNQNEFTGSIGLPIPSTQCCILDEEGKALGIGEAGELCVRGPQVMKGYWNQPRETAAVFTEEGWLRTGDIARMDGAGYFFIVDRKKDMILISGFNVYPNEIESVVNGHPGVLECGAVGVPDDQTGEAVKIFIVKKDPALTAEALTVHCRLNLTPYKRPKFIEFVDALPKTAVGKILRRRLKEMLQGEGAYGNRT